MLKVKDILPILRIAGKYLENLPIIGSENYSLQQLSLRPPQNLLHNPSPSLHLALKLSQSLS